MTAQDPQKAGSSAVAEELKKLITKTAISDEFPLMGKQFSQSTVTQYPTDQTPARTISPEIANAIKRLVIDTAVQDQFGARPKDLFGGEAHDPLLDALDAKRAQEKHEFDLRKGSIDARGSMLENQKKELDMELKLADAEKKGLIVRNQDPKVTPQQPQKPSDGSGVVDALTSTASENLTKGVFNAIALRKAQLVSSGQANSLDADKMDKEWREELGRVLSSVDSEKSLAYGPFANAGQIGNVFQVLGGLLDIVSGPLDIGTALFGGRLGPAGKAELLTRAISQGTNPLVRAQMNDAFNRHKLEETMQMKLGARGLGTLAGVVAPGDKEGFEQIENTAVNIQRLLRNAVPQAFGTNPDVPLGESFTQYQNIAKLKWDIENADSIEEINLLTQELLATEEAMRAPIRKFYQNGGKPEQLTAYLTQAQDRISEEYFKNDFTYQGDKEATNFMARQQITANDFMKKLTDFEAGIMERKPMDIDRLVKDSVPSSRYETYKKLQATEPKDAQEATATAALAGIVEDVSDPDFWNPGKLRTYLRTFREQYTDKKVPYGPNADKKAFGQLKELLLKNAPSKRKKKIEEVLDAEMSLFQKLPPKG